MTAVWIVAVVFLGVIGIVAVDGYFSLEKRKIDSVLRQQEINDGVAPGTYSRPYRGKKAYRKAQKEFEKAQSLNAENAKTERQKSEEEVRAELIRGIKDLQQRIDNIDTIMESKKHTKENNNNEN
jgi:hypothetical protein